MYKTNLTKVFERGKLERSIESYAKIEGMCENNVIIWYVCPDDNRIIREFSRKYNIGVYDMAQTYTL